VKSVTEDQSVSCRFANRGGAPPSWCPAGRLTTGRSSRPWCKSLSHDAFRPFSCAFGARPASWRATSATRAGSPSGLAPISVNARSNLRADRSGYASATGIDGAGLMNRTRSHADPRRQHEAPDPGPGPLLVMGWRKACYGDPFASALASTIRRR
jgi:hypothetical protein